MEIESAKARREDARNGLEKIRAVGEEAAKVGRGSMSFAESNGVRRRIGSL